MPRPNIWLRHLWSFAAAAIFIGVLTALVTHALWQESIGAEVAGDVSAALLISAGVTVITTLLVSKLQPDQLSYVSDSRKYNLEAILNPFEVGDVIDSLESGEELWWLETVPQNLDGEQDSLIRAMKRGARIKVLLLAPGSKSVKWRWEEIGNTWGSSLEDFRGGIRNLSGRLKNLAGTSVAPTPPWENFSMAEYDGLPSIPMVLKIRGPVVEEAYTSYFLGQPSHLMPYLQWRGPGDLTMNFYSYFEAKWSRAKQLV